MNENFWWSLAAIAFGVFGLRKALRSGEVQMPSHNPFGFEYHLFKSGSVTFYAYIISMILLCAFGLVGIVWSFIEGGTASRGTPCADC
jgi:hypothetical protein